VLGPVDEREDAIIVINSSGLIMAVNTATLGLFEYEKGEMEGKNGGLTVR